MKYGIASLLGLFSLALIHLAGAQNLKRPEAPEGWVLVEEQVLAAFGDEAEACFRKAGENLLRLEERNAAAEVRKGAAFLKLELGRAAAEAAQGLLAAIEELERLGDDLEQGNPLGPGRADSTFARAHQALAKHHFLKITESPARKESTRSGQDLKAAAVHLERGLIRAGYKMAPQVRSLLKSVRLLQGKLIEEAGKVNLRVERDIKALGEEIERLGDRLKLAQR